MKKQILFLVMLVAAVLAGVGSYGQVGPAEPYQTVPTAAPVCLIPTPFSSDTLCTADELHPVQGEVYTYTILADATDDIRWFVVNNNDVVSDGDSLVSKISGILPTTNTNIDPADGNGDYILNLGTTYNNYNSGTGSGIGNTTIEIAWKFFDGITDQVILVAYVEGADGCTNNIAAYRIIPQPAFTIDIASVLENGANPAGPLDAANSECISPVESAVYSGSGITPDGTLTVDYGENWVFFVVNGANYFDSWMPEFEISYADGATPPTAEASWAYLGDATSSDPAVWNTLTGTLGVGNTWTSANPVIAGASSASPGTIGAGGVPAPGGECIVVRVRLDWGTDIEHDLADGTLTFAANGVAYDGSDNSGAGTFYDDRDNFEDLHYATCEPDLFVNDVVDYIITPRPRADEVTPTPETKTGEGVN
ncbi:hypothetical protein [Mangrovibacterium lignilyticum]|uniref:hypothetical protein n=1 Tax=Mangrovibacterium lignilyticum TaxID=2668052 RepID=UPI0013D595D0|nr:hypothetical protein [Mangrovibacterium lignilyticum]